MYEETSRYVKIIESWIEALTIELNCIRNHAEIPEAYDYGVRSGDDTEWIHTDTNVCRTTFDGKKVKYVFSRFEEVG